MLDHVAGLSLAEMLERPVVGAAECSAPDPLDRLDVRIRGDLDWFAEPAVDGQAGEGAQVGSGPGRLVRDGLRPPSAFAENRAE